jgi:hypothetical protein
MHASPSPLSAPCSSSPPSASYTPRTRGGPARSAYSRPRQHHVRPSAAEATHSVQTAHSHEAAGAEDAGSTSTSLSGSASALASGAGGTSRDPAPAPPSRRTAPAPASPTASFRRNATSSCTIRPSASPGAAPAFFDGPAPAEDAPGPAECTSSARRCSPLSAPLPPLPPAAVPEAPVPTQSSAPAHAPASAPPAPRAARRSASVSGTISTAPSSSDSVSDWGSSFGGLGFTSTGSVLVRIHAQTAGRAGPRALPPWRAASRRSIAAARSSRAFLL